jgi:hypothetical protein
VNGYVSHFFAGAFVCNGIPHLGRNSKEDTVIKVSALYPKTEASTFDLPYYCEQH